MNKKPSFDQGDEEDFEFDFDSPRRKPDPKVPMPPERSKKTGGWAEVNTSNSSRNWLRRVSKSSPSKQTPKKETSNSQDSDNEIPVIPNLDDYNEEVSTEIANAPNVAVNRVMTYQELDNDLSRNIVFQSLDGIDLHLLTKYLGPEQKQKEDDVPWTWDFLFTDVSSHLTECETPVQPVVVNDVKKMSNNIQMQYT